MDKVTQAIEALKAAETAILEIVNPISVAFDKWGRREVLVETLRDLEQIPGEVRYEAFQAKDYPQYTAQAVKECNGYKFFCVLEELPEEARALAHMRGGGVDEPRCTIGLIRSRTSP